MSRYVKKGPRGTLMPPRYNIEEWNWYRENTHRYFHWNAKTIRQAATWCFLVPAGFLFLFIKGQHAADQDQIRYDATSTTTRRYWPESPTHIKDPRGLAWHGEEEEN